jgi:hypothetical protein
MVGPFYEFVDEALLQKFNITRPQPQECCAFIDYVGMIYDTDFGAKKQTVSFGSFEIVRVGSGSDIVYSCPPVHFSKSTIQDPDLTFYFYFNFFADRRSVNMSVFDTSQMFFKGRCRSGSDKTFRIFFGFG